MTVDLCGAFSVRLVLDSRCNVRELKVPFYKPPRFVDPNWGFGRFFLELFRPKNLEAMCRMLGPSERKSLGHQYFVGHPDTMDRVRYPR